MAKTLLIIEDDQDMCSELNETLTSLGYHVQTAFDGLSGKKLIDNNKYDIIITDLKMPVFDGYQILNLISTKKINSKVIVITARMKIHFEDIINQINNNEDELLKTANHILLKPFKISELISILEKL
jgi:DNA-binding response OmpR family regulator